MNGKIGAVELADSGDEEGEASITKGESKVEFVVVGEELVEVEFIEVILSRWYKDCVDCWRQAEGGLASVTSN